MNQKKIIWILVTVATIGTTTYSIFHQHTDEETCLFCHSKIILFIAGLIVIGGLWANWNNN